MKLLQSSLLTTAIFIAPLLASTTIQAAEWHQDPGNGCRAYYGSQQKDLNVSSSSVRANTNMWVTCPITSHGNIGGASNKMSFYVSLYQATNHSSACRVLKYNYAGSSGTWIPLSVQSGIGYKIIYKGGITPNNWENVSIACYLRTNDRISSVLSYN